MTPNKVYEDKLEIKNLTNDNYMLYIKIKKDSISDDELELLSNINILIHNKDNEMLYDGPATGTDYEVGNYKVDEIIYIGSYDPFSFDNLTINTTLKKDYDNTKNYNMANVEWEFYAMSDNKVEVINPNTKDNIRVYITVVFLIITFWVVYIIYKKRA